MELIKIKSEKGGRCILKADIPVKQVKVQSKSSVKIRQDQDGKTLVEVECKPGDVISIVNSQN